MKAIFKDIAVDQAGTIELRQARRAWREAVATPITEDDLFTGQPHADTAAPYTWLDDHSVSTINTPVADDIGFVDIDIDPVPTLYDVCEQSFEFNQGDDLLEAQPPASVSDVDAASATPEIIEDTGLDHHADNAAELTDELNDSSQPPMPSMEELFNQVRRDPVLLHRALLVLACTFQVIAAAALWRAIGDKVVATELVPPLVYTSIGVVAYLLGMRYLRIHFAQVRVNDKDWLQCEQVVVAADNGVMLKARFGTSYLIWEQLLGVAQDSDYYYLLIEPSQGFKVPKQGVSDPVLQVKLDDLASLTKAKAWEDS